MQTFVIRARDRYRGELHDQLKKALASLPYRRWERWLPACFALVIMIFLGFSLLLGAMGHRGNHILPLLGGVLTDVLFFAGTALLAGAASNRREVIRWLALSVVPFISVAFFLKLSPSLVVGLFGLALVFSCLLYLQAMKRYAACRGLGKTASSFGRLQTCSMVLLTGGIFVSSQRVTAGAMEIVYVAGCLASLLLMLAWPCMALRTCLVWYRELSVQSSQTP
jgi:hypothetical protein